MPDGRPEPLVGARFVVEIDGLSETAAVEVVFPEARIATERGKRLVRYGPLTLRRAATLSRDWYGWWDRARRPGRRPAGVARSVRVILIDRAGAPVVRWTMRDAEPIAYGLSPLNASVSAPLVESLELAVQGFEAEFSGARQGR
jgi:phage tail-like protein